MLDDVCDLCDLCRVQASQLFGKSYDRGRGSWKEGQGLPNAEVGTEY